MLSKGVYSFVSLALFLPLAATAADTNILVNPGFESGTDGWAGRNAAIAAVAAPVHSGAHSAKASGRTANWQGIKQSLWGKLVEGKPYRISGWVRLDNAPSGSISLSVEQQDDGGTNYYGVASATVTNGEWVQLSGEFTFHLTGVLSVLDVYVEGPPPGVDFFVDDVSAYGPELIPPPPVPVQPRATGRIDVGARHQKIEGFGASAAYYTANLVGHKEKAKLYTLLFKDLGLDILRLMNHHEINPAAFRESVEIAKEGRTALGGNLRIMLSSWSPPLSLKSNNSLVGGTLAKRGGKYVYPEFAQWWCDSLKAYAAAGLKVDYINIQNELNYEPTWESCRFGPTELADPDVAGHNVAYEAVWQKLNAELGREMPKMLAPEASSMADAKTYIAAMADLSHVYGYAHHLYDCDGCGANPDRYVSKMASFGRFAAEHGHKPVFQTEYEFAPHTWAGALNTALLIHNSLTAEGVASYLYWDLFWGPTSGLVSLDDESTYTIKPAYYTFKQYSAFIDADWQRVEASTDSPGLRISAYVSPDNKKLTAVILNTTTDADVTLKLAFTGVRVAKGEAFRSSKTENCVRVPDYKGRGPIVLPASSITTLSLVAGGA